MICKRSEHMDWELVQASLNGDVDSFGELYRRHYTAVVGIAYCVLSDRHLAEDAAQEAFAVACRDLNRLRQADGFAKWLSAICRNVAARMVKSKFSSYLSSENTAYWTDKKSGDDLGSLVRESVLRLSQSEREVIILRYFSDLSHEQIAVFLGISKQAVHGRLIRARKTIARDMKRQGLERR